MGLLALGIGYFVYDFRFHKRDVDPDDIVEARRIEQAITAGRSWITTGWGTGLVFAAGAVLHTGPSTYELGERIVAAPICSLWG